MQLKPFEAGRYDDELIVVRNPENGKQELFSNEEFEIIKFLKRNESESLLALLLPNIGIAKKHHIVLCLSVLSKLKRLQIVDLFSLTGKKPLSDTATLELEVTKERIRFEGLRSLVATAFGIFESVLGRLGPVPVFFLALALAASSLMLFPFERVDTAFSEEGIAYGTFLGVLYLSACGAFCFRALLQAAFLRGCGREATNHGLAFYPPFLSFHSDRSEVNLLGFRGRVQMALLGLLAPIGFSFFFSALAMTGKISLVSAYAGFAACIGVTLILASPIFSFDAAQIIHLMFLRGELKERIAKGLREIFSTRGSLSREMLFALLATFVWILVWLDCIRAFWETVSSQVVADFMRSGDPAAKIGAAVLMGAVLALLLLPLMVFLFSALKRKAEKRRVKIDVSKDKVRDSLSFEERMNALEKIPLFAYLNDQERLSLLNEMQPVYYAHGDFLVHQGEIGKEFYVLVKGAANAFFRDMQGGSYLLADLEEGDAFGEIALIDDVPRTASIVSDGGCIVLVLKKEGFDRFAASLGSPDRVKTMIRLTSFFRRHPLFSKLSAHDQAMLIDSFRFQTITAGEEIADAESDENFYVIYSGKVRVDTGDDSAETTLELDDCFGYANVLHAKYVATEGTGLLSVRQDEFHNLIWAKLVERPELFV